MTGSAADREMVPPAQRAGIMEGSEKTRGAKRCHRLDDGRGVVAD
jgi:hypothetical protein